MYRLSQHYLSLSGFQLSGLALALRGLPGLLGSPQNSRATSKLGITGVELSIFGGSERIGPAPTKEKSETGASKTAEESEVRDSFWHTCPCSRVHAPRGSKNTTIINYRIIELDPKGHSHHSFGGISMDPFGHQELKGSGFRGLGFRVSGSRV